MVCNKNKIKYIYIIVLITCLFFMTGILGYHFRFFNYQIQETFIIPLHNPQRTYELYYDNIYQQTNPEPQDIYQVILKEQLKNCVIKNVDGITKQIIKKERRIPSGTLLFRKDIYYSFYDFWNKAETKSGSGQMTRELYDLRGWDDSKNDWTTNLTGYNCHSGTRLSGITYYLTRLAFGGRWFTKPSVLSFEMREADPLEWAFLSYNQYLLEVQRKPFQDSSTFIKFDYDVYKGNSTQMAYDTPQEVSISYNKYKIWEDGTGNIIKQDTFNPQGVLIDTKTNVYFHQKNYDNYDTIIIYRNIHEVYLQNKLTKIDLYHKAYYLQKNISPIRKVD
ncbi:hypothetical protein [Candidatus Phytoplasma fraxini]|uniref:Uncharacterized protein n=1 Tax=Ash yellows phytoplasma TaxID=35780 RepID=A0ABZ2U814_ASHYP